MTKATTPLPGESRDARYARRKKERGLCIFGGCYEHTREGRAYCQKHGSPLTRNKRGVRKKKP